MAELHRGKMQEMALPGNAVLFICNSRRCLCPGKNNLVALCEARLDNRCRAFGTSCGTLC